MSSKTIIANAIQTMCGQIITNTNAMQTIASNLDSDGIIVDFDESLVYINTIGKLIEGCRKSGYVDVVTTDEKVIVNAIMKYSMGISSQTTKMTMGSVNVTKIFTIINAVETGACYPTDYTYANDDVIYPEPYDTSAYMEALTNIAQGFSTMSSNLNMFATPGTNAIAPITPSVSIKQVQPVEPLIVVQKEQTQKNDDDSNLQIVTSDLTLLTFGKIIGCDTCVSAITITLPDEQNRKNGLICKIFDAGGNAEINNIIILGNGLQINDSTSVTLAKNYAIINVIYSEIKNKWFII